MELWGRPPHAGAAPAAWRDVEFADGEPWRIELLLQLGLAKPVEVATGLSLHGAFREQAARYLKTGALP